MIFVLYGRYDPKVWAAARAASDLRGRNFSYSELDCDPVLIAFINGREIARTYDMTGVEDWINGLIFGKAIL